MGESMGGVLAADFLLRRPALLSGLILVAPSFKDRLNVPLKLKAEALLHVLLRRRKYYDLPWDPTRFTRDPAIIAFLEKDELEVRRVTGQFYFAYTPVAERARRGARFLRLPVLMLLPGEDLMIDTEYSRLWFERIEMEEKRVIEYPGHYHALLLDTGRERVFADAADWMLQQSSAGPDAPGKQQDRTAGGGLP
jgi:alpha-beta hydrolase superfamily lysophospholipase